MTWTDVEFSICVPTHNRAHLLPQFFEELARQSPELFELVIVNDGSTDGTSRVIRDLVASVPFRVRYADIPRGGRARALNRAMDLATGRFVVILGDDDTLVPGALERMKTIWQSIPQNQRDEFCGVCGLSVDKSGRILGDRFPSDTEDSDFFEMRVIRSVRGDKREAVLRSSIGNFRFKVFENETRAPTSSLWLHLAKSYRTRFVNEPWCVMTYRPDGMTKSLARIRMASAHSTAAHYRDVLDDFPAMPSRIRIRYIANLVRYTIHADQRPRAQLRGLPFFEVVIGSVVGNVAALTDTVTLFTRSVLTRANLSH